MLGQNGHARGFGGAGRTETTHTGKKKVVYVCPTYVAGRCNGHNVSCGYQRITHEEAERLLLDKIAELNLEYEGSISEHVSASIKGRINRLTDDDKESWKQWETWIEPGVGVLLDYLKQSCGIKGRALSGLEKLARRFYLGAEMSEQWFEDERLAMREFREAIKEAERIAVDEAKQQVADFKREHASYTRNWGKATVDMQTVLKQEIDRLESEIHEWESRTVPLTERVRTLMAAEVERHEERERLQAEWPTLENLAKGEALRRLFNRVTLRWTRTYRPARNKPSRPRKTNRPGRYSYTLKREEIEWSFSTPDLASSS